VSKIAMTMLILIIYLCCVSVVLDQEAMPSNAKQLSSCAGIFPLALAPFSALTHLLAKNGGLALGTSDIPLL